MISRRLGGLCAAVGLLLGLGGCVDDYGYGGVQVGYGSGYYGGPGYGGYGYDAFGPSNYGWYGDYFYPGTGVYVYDQYRRPFRWNGQQRRYWNGQQRYRGRDWNGRGNWNGFDRRPDRAYEGGRRWQPGTQVQPNRGWRQDRQWRQNGPGVSPGTGNRVRPEGYRGNRSWNGSPGSRDRGNWSGRGGRSGRRD